MINCDKNSENGRLTMINTLQRVDWFWLKHCKEKTKNDKYNPKSRLTMINTI